MSQFEEAFEIFSKNVTSELADLKNAVFMPEKLSKERDKKKWLKEEEEKLVRYFTDELKRLMKMGKPAPDKAKTLPATTSAPRSREKKDFSVQGSPVPGTAQPIKPRTSTTPPQTGESLGSSEQPFPNRPEQKATEQKSTSTVMKKSDGKDNPEDGSSLEGRRIEELDECHHQIKKLEKKEQQAKTEAAERKSEINALKNSLEKANDDHARRYSGLEKEFQELRTREQQTKTEAAERKSEINALKNSLEKAKDDHARRYSGLEKEFQALKTRKQEAIKNVEERDSEIVSLKKDLQKIKNDQERELEDLHHKLRNRQDSIDKKDTKIRELDNELKEYERMEREQLQKIEKVKAEKDEWMNKFGKLASDKVESSPDVTDLGDPDRALKLADRYRDMYDNLWTKTFVAQRKLKKFQEKDIVKNLLDILMGAFSYCEGLAQAQESSLRNLLLHPIQENISELQMKQIDIKHQQLQKMKELRKQWAVGTSAVDEVKQAYLASEQKKLERIQSDAREEGYDKADLIKRMDVSKDFYRKCAEVCWLMVLHDPPLYLKVNIKRGDPCNRDLYTMRSEGDQVKALVWPPLFQGEGGGLLAQGVVEGLKSAKRSDV